MVTKADIGRKFTMKDGKKIAGPNCITTFKNWIWFNSAKVAFGGALTGMKGLKDLDIIKPRKIGDVIMN